MEKNKWMKHLESEWSKEKKKGKDSLSYKEVMKKAKNTYKK